MQFHSEEIDFSIEDPKPYLRWFESVANHYGYSIEDVNFIFCSDEYLLQVNQEHLAHDYYTDIITFDYVKDKQLSGDLFISIDRVKDNAKNLQIDFNDELDRVMIHGILHLIGYQDNTEAKQLEIRAQEDFCLTLRSKI